MSEGDPDLEELARASVITQRAPGRDLSKIKAGRANSGKWHLCGEFGCLSSNINANINAVKPVTELSKGRRDWCYYCEMQLTVYRLQAEIDRLKAALDGTDRGETDV